MKSWQVTSILSACAMAALAAGSGSAYAVTVNAADGSATAIFTLGSGFVDIKLINNVTTTRSVTDLLSDLSFSISGGLSIPNVTHGGRTVIPAAPNGTLVCVKGTAGCVAGGAGHNWYYGNNVAGFDGAPVGTGTYLLTALISNPKSLIIGDHSFACNGPGNKCPDGLSQSGFQPYYNGSATFHLLIGGIDSGSTVSQVNFSFGTEPERVVGVPIPGAVWLFASGLLGLIAFARRRIGVGSNTLAPV